MMLYKSQIHFVNSMTPCVPDICLPKFFSLIGIDFSYHFIAKIIARINRLLVKFFSLRPSYKLLNKTTFDGCYEGTNGMQGVILTKTNINNLKASKSPKDTKNSIIY